MFLEKTALIVLKNIEKGFEDSFVVARTG